MTGPVLYIGFLILYFIILILIGWATKGKVVSAEDFTIGGRKIGPFVTALSFVATYFSSVLIIGGGGFGFKYGMSTIWIGASNVLIGTLLCWIILAKRVRKATERLGVITISEFFNKRYNSTSAMIFSSFIISLFLVVYNVSVLKGMANILEVLINIPYIWGLVISGLVITFYLTFGGYFAVVWTGVFQAFLMILGLFLLTGYTFDFVGGFSEAHLKLSQIGTGYVETPGIWGWAGLISYCLIVSFGVWGMPQLVIRFYSIKSVKALRISIIVATVSATIALLPYLNGAISRILFPDLTNPDLAIPKLTEKLMPPWASAIFLTGVISAGMSTFAGVQIIITSSIIRDILKNSFNKKISDKKELKLNKLLTIFIGLISILIAIKPPALILVLTAFSWAVIASTNLWPLLFGVYWRRTSKLGTILSMVLGSTSALVWIIFKNPFNIHGFIIGISVAFLTIFISTLIRPEKNLPKF